MQNIIVFLISCLILLLLIRALINLVSNHLKFLYHLLYKPLIKVKHYNKSDYRKAFKYLIKRNKVTKAEQIEERLFFLSLINEATNIKQLEEFTKQIKKFYRKKIKLIAARKFKKQQQTYLQQYKEIVIFLIMAINNRYEIINQFEAINDYQAFAELLLTASEITAIDAILMFAEKLKLSDYKKIQRLAQQKKASINPQAAANGQSINNFSLVKVMIYTVSSVCKYCLYSYLFILFMSLAVSLIVPKVVTSSNDKLLQLANIFKTQPFLPHFAKLNTGYYVHKQKIYFHKQTSFFEAQKKYYLPLLTNNLCKTATFKKVCSRNK